MADGPANEAPFRLIRDVEFGEDVVVQGFANLYGCRIDAGARIGTFVEVQAGAIVGRGTQGAEPHVRLRGRRAGRVGVRRPRRHVRERSPPARCRGGRLAAERDDWTLDRVIVDDRASIGSGAVVVGPVRIGRGALVGAGAVVTRDVAPGTVVTGVPARLVLATREDAALVGLDTERVE